MRITIKKEVLIGLVSLGVSFQTLAENKKTYYPTGEVELVKEYAGGKQSKSLWHAYKQILQFFHSVAFLGFLFSDFLIFS